MITLETIQTWTGSGIVLAVVDHDRLRVTGPPDRMTVDVQAKIRANKVEIIRLLSLDVASGYDDWTDGELWELWQERSAIMEHDGGLSTKNANEVSKQWFISLIGEKRFARIAPNARSMMKPPNDTPENIVSQISNVALDPTNCKTKWLPDARTPDSLSTQLNRS